MNTNDRDGRQAQWPGISREEDGSFSNRIWPRLIPMIQLTLVVPWLFVLACSASRSSSVSVNESSSKDAGAATMTAGESTSETFSRPPEYRIGVLDELEIRFQYHERFNDSVTVRPDGRITLENIGEIYVAGMTPLELDQLITESYAKIVHDPEVTVFVRGFASRWVYVLGEVDKPGVLELKPNMTALQAMASVGGPMRGAKLNSVMVLRRNQAGALSSIRLDLSRAAIKETAIQDLQLRPQDIVYVPRTFITSVDEFLAQIYAGLLPPLDTYLRALREYNRGR